MVFVEKAFNSPEPYEELLTGCGLGLTCCNDVRLVFVLTISAMLYLKYFTDSEVYGKIV